MDREEIANTIRLIETKNDFLELLNRIKRENIDFADNQDQKTYPFTMRQLNFYINPKHTTGRYKEFYIKKKSGGMRRITAPRTKTFQLMLSAVNEILKAVYVPTQFATGFVEGRSIVDNAVPHQNQYYVFNTDLKDFFPSIDQARVWKRLQVKPYIFPEKIANLIAGLCSMQMISKEDGEDTIRYVLPQGAPTSPILTNMICERLDRQLAGLAKRYGLRYTRYADDITFSSLHNIYQEGGEFRKELEHIIKEQRFTINNEKTRLQKAGERQEVTGLVVNQRVNVPNQYVRNIRNLLYIWDRYGYDVAYNCFLPKYQKEKGHVKKEKPNLSNVIEGKLLYLKMVKGENDPVYRRLFDKFNSLTTLDHAQEIEMSEGVSIEQLVALMEPDISDIDKLNNDLDELLMRSYGG